MEICVGRTDSLDQGVYEQLLQLLRRRGVIHPEILSDVSLAEELGVSRTPVRTALSRLEGEGLLRKVRGKGWSTLTLTVHDIEEIFDLKEILQPYVAAKAACNLTPAQADTLMEIIREMRNAVEQDDQDAEMAADLRFHELIFQIADNSRLSEFDKRLDCQWYPLRKGSFILQGGMNQSLQEHQLIAEAIVARYPDLASDLTRKHHQRVRHDLIHIMENVLRPFLGD